MDIITLSFGMNVCISIPEGIFRPNFIKHVEFNGEDERAYSTAVKELENTLFFKYLESKESFSLQQLMAVTFNTPMQEEANIKLCKDILKKGIFCDGKIFRFLGHSSDQLREKTCFMMEGSDEEIQSHLNFGDFVDVSDVNIRAKKIGFLFSPFYYFVKVNKDPREVVDSNYDSRFMSPEFAGKVRAEIDVNYPEPSALLVHYQGFQGILVLRTEHVNTPLQDQSQENTQQVTIPQEMSRPLSNLAGILDYSRPHESTYLDAKLVILLAARGVRVEYLRDLQTDYYRLLENMCNDTASRDYFLRLTGRTIEGSQIQDIGTLRREEVRNMVERNGSGIEDPRVRILVPKARVVFRVPDPFEDLNDDECYFKPTLLHGERSEFKGEKKVFVVRTPCYHPGDIHVFKLCHEKPAYQNLIDCLVLPHGHTIENAKPDLNRNWFIVCWDKNLIPIDDVEPCCYSLTFGERMGDYLNKRLSYFRRSPPKTKELREELIDHFASFEDDLPSRIDQVYLDLARRDSGLLLTECEELSNMYYQAANCNVNKEGIWRRLEKLEESKLSEVEKEEEDEEQATTEEHARNISLGGVLSLITCGKYRRNREFHIGGKMLGDFETAASTFVQKARGNHFFD